MTGLSNIWGLCERWALEGRGNKDGNKSASSDRTEDCGCPLGLVWLRRTAKDKQPGSTPHRRAETDVPSRAYVDFRDNHLVDVDRLISSHASLGPTGPGRRGLGHLTRGGMLLLCAAWEVYIESVLVEGVCIFCERFEVPGDLPDSVRQRLARQVREARHELEPLRLAGAGWKDVLREYSGRATERLNTPNGEAINRLFERYLGVQRLTHHWTLGRAAIDDFVEQRGRIAHKGRAAHYVTIRSLRRYRDQVLQAAVDTDNHLREHIGQVTQERVPWNQTQL